MCLCVGPEKGHDPRWRRDINTAAAAGRSGDCHEEERALEASCSLFKLGKGHEQSQSSRAYR